MSCLAQHRPYFRTLVGFFEKYSGFKSDSSTWSSPQHCSHGNKPFSRAWNTVESSWHGDDLVAPVRHKLHCSVKVQPSNPQCAARGCHFPRSLPLGLASTGPCSRSTRPGRSRLRRVAVCRAWQVLRFHLRWLKVFHFQSPSITFLHLDKMLLDNRNFLSFLLLSLFFQPSLASLDPCFFSCCQQLRYHESLKTFYQHSTLNHRSDALLFPATSAVA